MSNFVKMQLRQELELRTAAVARGLPGVVGVANTAGVDPKPHTINP